MPKHIAFNALQPTARPVILAPPLRRIGQRWRATRAPQGCHTAQAVSSWGSRLPFKLPLAQSDKRIVVSSLMPNIHLPRFREEIQ